MLVEAHSRGTHVAPVGIITSRPLGECRDVFSTLVARALFSLRIAVLTEVHDERRRVVVEVLQQVRNAVADVVGRQVQLGPQPRRHLACFSVKQVR